MSTMLVASVAWNLSFCCLYFFCSDYTPTWTEYVTRLQYWSLIRSCHVSDSERNQTHATARAQLPAYAVVLDVFVS